MSKVVASWLLAGGLLLGLAAPSLGTADTSTSNATFPIELVSFVPCANADAGEFVSLRGDLHVLSTITVDARGGLHATFLFQPQGVSGVGLTTGDIYRGVGETRETISIFPGFAGTLVNNFILIGAGPGNNLFVRDIVHLTANANGIIVVSVDQTSLECR